LRLVAVAGTGRPTSWKGKDSRVRKRRFRAVLGFALALLTAGPALGSGPAAAGATASDTAVYQGTIDGAEFRAEVPGNWNGTLILWSHAAYRFGFVPAEVELTNQPATKQWLLDHGYAVAASKYQPVSGWVVQQALHDQLELLSWFQQHVGIPRRTVAEGAQMGGLVSTLLAERHPGLLDGVVSLCGYQAGSVATWNLGLDFGFVVKTLLPGAADLQLAHVSDPDANWATARDAIISALGSAQGRARLALAGAVADLPPWSSPLAPQPTDLDSQLSQQAGYYGTLLRFNVGSDRVKLEQLAGGNPSSNLGVDYGAQLARSSQRALAEQAYAAAGLDLDADLDRLAAAPRISPDAAALRYQARYGTPAGTTPVPALTVHTVGDGLAPPEHERQYADQVDRNGDPAQLRQLYVPRGGHCTFTASEELVALQAMLDRLESGRWPSTDPAVLTAAASAFDAAYQTVHLPNGDYAPVTPGFIGFAPAPFLRPYPS
jgi:pimeloyl-ACP methyl ester carboxylesterase